MAKKKGGSRPPRNIELIRGSNQNPQSNKDIIKQHEEGKGLSFEERENKRRTGNIQTPPEHSKIHLKNYKEEQQQYVRKDEKSNNPQQDKNRQKDVEREREIDN